MDCIVLTEMPAYVTMLRLLVNPDPILTGSVSVGANGEQTNILKEQSVKVREGENSTGQSRADETRGEKKKRVE